MIWLLPVIVIGGLFVPALGYLVLAMMAFFIPLSFFKGRYWCANLCPRGAFLDIVISKISLNKPAPRIFARQWFRWAIFALFIGFFIFRLGKTGGNFIFVGAVFVGMCVVSTIISIILGIATKRRGWCVICPMGTLQEAIGKAAKRSFRRTQESNTIADQEEGNIKMEFTELKDKVKLFGFDEVRKSSHDYFEAVVATAKIKELTGILEGFFGLPALPSKNKLPPHINGIVEEFGGIMGKQTLYFREAGPAVVIAMLWPWQDGAHTTIKVIQKTNL